MAVAIPPSPQQAKFNVVNVNSNNLINLSQYKNLKFHFYRSESAIHNTIVMKRKKKEVLFRYIFGFPHWRLRLPFLKMFYQIECMYFGLSDEKLKVYHFSMERSQRSNMLLEKFLWWDLEGGWFLASHLSWFCLHCFLLVFSSFQDTISSSDFRLFGSLGFRRDEKVHITICTF